MFSLIGEIMMIGSMMLEIAVLSTLLVARQPKHEMLPSRKVGGAIVVKSSTELSTKLKRPRSKQLVWINLDKKNYVLVEKNKIISKK